MEMSKTRLKELRKKNKLTLKELSRDLDIRDNTLSQYENDKRSAPWGFISQVADYFNVSLDYLMRRTDVPDFEFNDEKSAISLIKRVAQGEIDSDSFSNQTLLNLVIWVSEHEELFSPIGKYNDYIDTVSFLSHALKHNLESLVWFTEKQSEAENTAEKIEKEIMLADGIDYPGATLKDIDTFIQESKRIDFEYTEAILSIMKKLPNENLSDDFSKSIDDSAINKIVDIILNKK